MLHRVIQLFSFLLLFSVHAMNAAEPGLGDNEDVTILQIDSLIETSKKNIKNSQNSEEIITALNHAIELSVLKGYDDGYVRASYNLGKCYLWRSNNAKAASQYFMTLKKAEQINDSFHISKSILQLGLVMYNLNKWTEAINYFNRSIEFRKSKNEDHSYHLEEYLAGLCYFKLTDYDKSKELLTQALYHAKLHKDTMKTTEVSVYLTHIDLELNYNDSIIPAFNRFFEFFKAQNDKVGMCYSLIGKSKAYLKEGNAIESVNFANLALSTAKDLKLPFVIKDVLEIMVNAQYKKENYKEASKYMIELESIKDSIQSMNTQSDIAMLSAGYMFEKKEAEYTASIEKQKSQRKTLILIAVGLVIIVISIVYFLNVVSKERKRSDLLLLNILPEDTAKELKDFGSSIPKSHEEVTIAFLDIKSFTNIAKDMEAYDLVKMLDTYFRSFDSIIDNNGLEKIKTIGDAYMFVSGLKGNKDHALNAVKAGIEMMDSIKKLESQMKKEYGTCFNFRMGIHTGEVVSGVVGSRKYAFDIWGDAVNIAARMEENSTPGKINLTKSTYKLVRSKYPCTYRGNIDIKNHNSIDMYFVDSE